MEPIAIIGFTFKLPQDTEEEPRLWEILKNRQNLATEWPESRLQVDSLYDGGSKKNSRV